MGRRSQSGGVAPIGTRRIRFDFMFEGRRYRPSVRRTPTDANLRRAREQLAGIKARIDSGTFSFVDEFPHFRDLASVPDSGQSRTCDDVFDAFLDHCESRRAKNDLAPITLSTYRRVLDHFWRPKLGRTPLLAVRYSMLARIADQPGWKKKTYNNAISVLRRAFKHGFHDFPDRHNPAFALKGARIRRKDRTCIDPFSIHDAEALIAAIHRDWGQAQGNYDEFRFFTGLRPSEQVALRVSDFDPVHGTISITKACVGGITRDCTKTGEDRQVHLNPRALQLLHRQLALREALISGGKIEHDYLFFKENGEPIRNLQYAHSRWRRTLLRLPGIRYRKPYCARHSSVSWNLMTGHSALWVAKQHGHSIATMLRAYAAWTEGSMESDLDVIRAAMVSAPRTGGATRSAHPEANVRSPPIARRPSSPAREPFPHRNLALDLALARVRSDLSSGFGRKIMGERHPHRPPST